jgi:hypothetical protein
MNTHAVVIGMIILLLGKAFHIDSAMTAGLVLSMIGICYPGRE